MSAIWTTIKKSSPWLIALAVAVVAWNVMGAAGYRAGNTVGAGPVDLDPEALRGIVALALGLVAALVGNLPYGQYIQSILNSIKDQLTHDGPSDPLRLTPAEEREQFDIIKTLKQPPTS